MLYSGLQRCATPEDLRRSLTLFDRALERLRQNPPRAFVLENVASLLALPDVLSHIERALETLPYIWRCDALTPLPQPHSFLPLPHPSVRSRCALLCPHADSGADITRPRIWWVGLLEE